MNVDGEVLLGSDEENLSVYQFCFAASRWMQLVFNLRNRTIMKSDEERTLQKSIIKKDK